MNALREIYRKLVPGGVLGMIWNIEDCNVTQENDPQLVPSCLSS